MALYRAWSQLFPSLTQQNSSEEMKGENKEGDEGIEKELQEDEGFGSASSSSSSSASASDIIWVSPQSLQLKADVWTHTVTEQCHAKKRAMAHVALPRATAALLWRGQTFALRIFGGGKRFSLIIYFLLSFLALLPNFAFYFFCFGLSFTFFLKKSEFVTCFAKSEEGDNIYKNEKTNLNKENGQSS